MPKYVVSSILTDPEWNNTRVLSGGGLVEEVTRLKDEVDGDIWVAGSIRLVRDCSSTPTCHLAGVVKPVHTKDHPGSCAARDAGSMPASAESPGRVRAISMASLPRGQEMRYISNMTSSPGEELRAAVSARRDLGPDFEDAIVESFLDKMGKEVDRRVDERLAAERPKPKGQTQPDRLADGQRLALAIVSLVMGTGATIPLALGGAEDQVFLIVWLGVVAVNLAFALGRRR